VSIVAAWSILAWLRSGAFSGAVVMNILPFRHGDEGVHAAVGANPGAAAGLAVVRRV